MYTIVDIETTGGRYNEEGITEIAIHKFDGNNVVDSFISLVNPEKEIQPFVVKLTGINSKMLRNAPKFYEIAKRIIEITKDSTLVAHNASFDYRILRTEFKRLGYDFEAPTLCTVELSKKLIPGLESYSLGKLCRSIGIPVTDRHRANGDAIATTKLLEILLQKDTEKIIVKSTIKSGNKRDLSKKLLTIIDELPTKTGVFYFHRYNGDILFIGKGKSIKKVINQVFLRTSKKARSLQKELVSVTYDITGSELIALLKYQEEIKTHSPKYNKKSKQKIQYTNFSNENMILIDKGRDVSEKSVILIENNTYKGYGFADLSYQINNLDILKSLITSTSTTEIQNDIIIKYLKNNTIEKIIRF
ncbi:MAG: DNA polymerase III subunit epsilon [Flavobacteriaceae bacterium]|nr:DNA polymerase III subunit epsilon [Flavobacteriaceae bacterium]